MRTVEVELIQLHPNQWQVFDHPARFKVVAAGRRWGKTVLGVIKCIETAVSGGRVWWVGPDYQRTTPAWRDLVFYASQIPECRISESLKTVYFPGGGEVVVKTADDPQALRGEGLSGVLLDEAAYMKPEAWSQALSPALADRKGWALFISTPAGRNWFWELFKNDGRFEGWKSWQRPSTDNTFLDGIEQEIEQYRLRHGDAFTSQEWRAEFLDYASLRPFRQEWLQLWPDDKAEVPDATQAVGRPWFDIRIGTDNAISLKDEANRSAVVVVGQSRLPGPFLGCLFVLSAEAGHWTAYEHANKVCDAAGKYGVKLVYYEDVNFQKAFGEILDARQRDRALSFQASRSGRTWTSCDARRRGPGSSRPGACTSGQASRS